MHPRDPKGFRTEKKIKYAKWQVPNCLLSMMEGGDAPHTRPWLSAEQIIAICNVGQNHWVTVRISLTRWTVAVYDSLAHDDVSSVERRHQMKPITRMLPRLLIRAGYWHNNPFKTPHEADDYLTLEEVPCDDQFVQEDSISCGVFACAYLDRLVTGNPKRAHVKDGFLPKYRASVAKRIWSLSLDV